MSKNNTDRYFCSFILNIPWLTANITVLNFAPLGDFLMNLEHSHFFMELLYIRFGSVKIQVGEKEFHLKEKDLFYLNSRVPHTISATTDQPVSTYNVSFLTTKCSPTEKMPVEWIEDEELLVNSLFKNDYLYTQDIYGCSDDLDQILYSMESRRRGEFVKVKNYLSNFIMSALQAFTKFAPHPRFDETLDSDLSFSAIKTLYYIREHFTEGISLSSVAEALHYSPRQCQRIIHEVMGVSFSSLLLDFQLSYAKMLLCSSDSTTLEKISELAGFSSSRSFYRHFKEQEGISPQKYRQNMSEHNS